MKKLLWVVLAFALLLAPAADARETERRMSAQEPTQRMKEAPRSYQRGERRSNPERRSGRRMTDEERRDLHRDLDRADRELYRRR